MGLHLEYFSVINRLVEEMGTKKVFSNKICFNYYMIFFLFYIYAVWIFNLYSFEQHCTSFS